jgi:hypothetical protein
MKRLALVLVAYSATALAIASYSLTTTIPWTPKNSTLVDQGAVVNGTYYLSDRTNGVVHIVDLASGTETGRISGFAGTHFVNGTVNKPTSGPNGLLPIPGRNELYAGDGDGSVKVIDLSNHTIVDIIKLGISKRADEMIYDAQRKLAVVTGPDDDIAVAVFISVTDRTIVGRISFPNATNGIEQPAWNPTDGAVYMSVPETDANPGGEIDVIDTSTFKVTKILPEPECNSAGIVFGPTQQLLLGCSGDSILADGVAHALIMDVTTGKISATVSGVGGADQVTYNPTTNWYYLADYQNLANGSKTGAPEPKLAIIDAATGKLVQTITTDNVTAQSVAVDPKSNKLIIPLAAHGIAIYDLTNSTSTSASTSAASSPAASATAKSGAAKDGFVSFVVLFAAAGAAAVAGVACN